VNTTVETSGRILHLQRLSTEDGPGIRTTVFFKGCPLHCTWCHNPESISSKFQIQWFADRCIGCDTCLETCDVNALSRQDGRLLIDRETCTGCGSCTNACPTTALEMLGRNISIPELMAELVKDRVYYDKSGGGVTLSGGEPGTQAEFSEGLLSELRAAGISTALDTCGLINPDSFMRLLPLTDYLLFDIKTINGAEHKRFTAQSNRLILQNLMAAGEYIRENQGKPVLWIRTPLIPGATAEDDCICDIGQYLADNLRDCVARWELCAFNNLCCDKYSRLGLDWEFAKETLITREELERFETLAKNCGLAPERVAVTGHARSIDNYKTEG
jgi:pyruvate formate lyase activating enzyme